jgi:formylglycine-generating enzyme required for sulfatase activity
MNTLTRASALLLFASQSWAALPQTVQDLAVSSVGAGDLQLAWSPVTQADNGNALVGVTYEVHRSTTAWFTPSVGTLLAQVHENSFTDHAVPDEGYYRVVVRGYEPPQPDLIPVPGGLFAMGQVDMAAPIHDVQLLGSYSMGRREVSNQEFLTAAQWALDQGLVVVEGGDLVAHGRGLLMMSDARCEIGLVDGDLVLRTAPAGLAQYPAGYTPGTHPVKMVSWYGAASYCDWISQMTGLQAFYGSDFDIDPTQNNPYVAQGYRLPTEAEWEFAAQYDNERTYPWGNQSPTCTRAVFTSCYDWTAPVGSKPTGNNVLGMQDMAGNVFEWCNDWSGDYEPTFVVDPLGALSSERRIIRGGGWDSISTQLGLAQRYHSQPLDYWFSLGFRVARSQR